MYLGAHPNASDAPLNILRPCRRLAASVGYVGAATVEFLYVLEEQQYYFLELNPRLQVEHPVTEWLANVNLPACQVMVGMGLPLTAMPDIRALYERQADAGAIDFEHDAQARFCGSAVLWVCSKSCIDVELLAYMLGGASVQTTLYVLLITP